MTDQQVERVARALANEFGYGWVFDERVNRELYDVDYWRHLARQAMAAVQEKS